MSYFHRPDGGFEPPASTEESPRSPFTEVAGRFANWISGADRIVGEQPQVDEAPASDPMRELTAGPLSDESAPFPLAPFGYNRAAVDEHLAELERELAELRADRQPPVSITEELERIGEQTASILVVAHDKAQETTRLAQQQADRCVADAAANAVAITTQAKDRLRELDVETDAVWRERERLLEDVRGVSAALATLADEATERFPAADAGAMSQATAAFPMAFGPEPGQFGPDDPDRSDGDGHRPDAAPGDTGSWLAGLQPPDQP